MFTRIIKIIAIAAVIALFYKLLYPVSKSINLSYMQNLQQLARASDPTAMIRLIYQPTKTVEDQSTLYEEVLTPDLFTAYKRDIAETPQGKLLALDYLSFYHSQDIPPQEVNIDLLDYNDVTATVAVTLPYNVAQHLKIYLVKVNSSWRICDVENEDTHSSLRNTLNLPAR